MSDVAPLFAGRTAILGGTFNPVHIGHLRFALEAAEALGLARVELTPCAVPPHKPAAGLLPFELREAFLRAAVAEEPLLTVSLLEAELPAPSYTCNLLAQWTERRQATPVFILGDEDFACLDTWREGLSLPTFCDLVVVPRAGAGPRLFEESVARFFPGTDILPCGPDGQLVGCVRAGTQSFDETASVPGFDESRRVHRFDENRRVHRLDETASVHRLDESRRVHRLVYLPLPRLDISASALRARWLAGASLRFLVPDAVLDLMRVHEPELRRVWN